MQARAYEINGQAADGAVFTAVACDPARSVVVEACAGSGKTWLLVARMLRLLLAGAEPAELLAITFTRKAAQEMRERLLQLLEELALAPEEKVSALLLERGVARHELPKLMPAARGLYARVLSSPHGLSIDTFHSWFARLLQIAPLASGVPHGYALTENTDELRAEAWRRFMQMLNEEDGRQVRTAMLVLYERVGDSNTRELLDAFLDKRAEWWAIQQAGEGAALEWLRQLCGEDAERDARLALWEDQALCARVTDVARLLGCGSPTNQKRAVAIESALSAGPSVENFAALCHQFFDGNGEPRRNQKTKALTQALEQRYGADGAAVFDAEFEELAASLLQLQRRSFERQVLEMNEALFIAGAACLEHYQAVKAEQRVFDFADLEWHAYRLLRDPDHASYLHSRLDARYRHILLDEFQDTNPLQWSIVRAWLDAYGGDADQPSVFVVGDPKQSIYRFRRAEPRVFDAARDMLAAAGADLLRTNQTRRNAGAIVAALNESFAANPIFHPQTTLSSSEGAVWRLALARVEEAEEKEESAGALRNPLLQARAEQEDMRRVEEGRAIARALLRATEELAAREGRPRRWSDAMLLVRKRTHLAAYETALREAGIPFVSDRRGGLLQALEASDLTALLTFLITPGDNVALAHVLKSPLFSASDEDLIALAQRDERTWWARLQAASEAGCSPALRRAADLLSRWLEAAPRLPVHDLLDLVQHQGDLLARYARATHPTRRAQALGNLEAYIELALELDAGRYPSLPRFIEQLRLLKRGAENQAPDEASIDATADAVRIMTIHGAKGLEAPIVVMADTNHSEAAREDCGILCDWPQDADAPTHFSCFGRKAERGAARDALFEAEQGYARQEDWNLLYVALTRAKNILIVSGVAESNPEDGVKENSWYARLSCLPLHECEEQAGQEQVEQPLQEEFELTLFDPLPQPAPLAAPVAHSAAIEEGTALHGLLERLTTMPRWPLDIPSAAEIARWVGCRIDVARTVRAQAERILQAPELERFFNPALYLRAHNELEAVSDGVLLRMDRVVVCEEEVWILDYKRDLLDSERAAYAAQLEGYRRALVPLFPDKRVRSALITADGGWVEM